MAVARLRTFLWAAALAVFVYVQWTPDVPTPVRGADKLGHALLYAFVGALTWLVLPGERAARSAVTVAAGYLAGILMEAGQPGFGRRYELGDLQADVVGLATAAVVMPALSLYRASTRRRRTAASAGSWSAGAEVAATAGEEAKAGGGGGSGGAP